MPKFEVATKAVLGDFENEAKDGVNPEDVMYCKETVCLNSEGIPDDLCDTEFTITVAYSDKDVFKELDGKPVKTVSQFISKVDPTFYGCWYSDVIPADPDQFIEGLLDAMEQGGKITADYYEKHSFKNYL